MAPSLPPRLLALILALFAGTAAAAPPCLDLLIAGKGCAGAFGDQGCQDDCCDDEDCTDDCGACPCCPLRAPATMSAEIPRLPSTLVEALEIDSIAPPLARPREDVFRPPRRSA